VSTRLRQVFRLIKDRFQLDEFAKPSAIKLPFEVLTCESPLFRSLESVPQVLFENKKINLSLAIEKINGTLLRQGQVFSFWHLVGAPLKKKGYLDGLIISQGRADSGVGGGLCQIANALHWLVLHSDLTVIERHRHSFDLFPDADRKIPFGTGATLVYNFKDIRFKNNTPYDYQFNFDLTESMLKSTLLISQKLPYKYQVIEEDHYFRKCSDGYYRHNTLFKFTYDEGGLVLSKDLIQKNAFRCQYIPDLEEVHL